MKKLIIFLIFSCLASIMHGQKISDLPAAATVNGTDLTAIVQSGVTKKATMAKVLQYVLTNLPEGGAEISISGDTLWVDDEFLVITGESHWSEDESGNLTNNNTGKVILPKDSTYYSGIPDQATKVGRLLHVNQYGKTEWTSPVSLHQATKDTLIKLKSYGRENILTVGALEEMYDDFSTAVAAAGTGDIVDLSNATFTESGTITMPANSTLKINEGGLLSGTFTLIGNNTRLDAGIYQCFGSDVTITGTWIVDKTYVDWFGMIGAANEGGELNKAISFCKLTTGKNLVFQNKHYYVENFQTLWEGGGTIEGNGATFHHTYAIDNYEEFLDIYGTVGTYDTLAVNAVYGSYILDVPVGSALLSLNRGDMVKIISDQNFDGVGSLSGEIKIVDTVIAAGRNVVFTEPLYNTYYASENARMAKVTPGEAILKDFKVIGNTGRSYNLGIVLKYIKEPLIQNVETNNFQYCGFGIYNCYAGRFDVVANNALDNTGQGYGLMLSGANMNNLITVRGFKLRHITTTGGNASGGGLAYNNQFINCIGTGVYAHAYDMHEATGSGNKYFNCRATGGVFVSDIANFQGEWSGAVTYDNNDIVAIASDKNQYSQLYKSTTNGNLNNSPITDLGTNWEVYNNQIYGFNILCGNATIENCEVSGFNSGIAIVNMNRRNMKIDGLKAINCRYAVAINADTLSNTSFNNIQLQNETFKDDAFAIYLNNSTLNKVSFSNISAKGGFGFFVDGCTFTDKKLEINSVVGDGLLMIGTQTSEVNFNVGTAFLTQKTNPGYVIYSGTGNGLKTINVNNMTVQGAAARPVVIANRLNSLTFGNVYLLDGTTSVFIDNNDSIDRCSINYFYNGGSGDLEILDNTGTYTGSQYVGNSGGTINTTPSLKGTVIANQTHFQNATAYRLDLAETVAGLYHGYISMNGVRWAHGHRSGTYLGRSSGNSDIDNLQNIGIGDNTLTAGTDADDNVAIGYYAGDAITDGDQNVIIGSNAGGTKTTGSGNVIIGYNAANAAGFATTSNQLIIDNSNSTTPLIYGDFSADSVVVNGDLNVTGIIVGLDSKVTAGYTIPINAGNWSTPADATVYYFGGIAANAPGTTVNEKYGVILKSGTIKAISLINYASGTAGSNEDWIMKIRINNTTDYPIDTISTTDPYRRWINTGMNITVSAGDTWEIKTTTPSWATNPTTILTGGYLYVEQ